MLGALSDPPILQWWQTLGLVLAGLVVVAHDIRCFDFTLACYVAKEAAAGALTGKHHIIGAVACFGAVLAVALSTERNGTVLLNFDGLGSNVSGGTGGTVEPNGVKNAGLAESDMFREYGRIFALLTAMDCASECGGRYVKRFALLWRNYSTEITTATLLWGLTLSVSERRVVEHSLIVLLSYRAACYLLIRAQAVRAPAVVLYLFKLYGVLNYGWGGPSFVRVTDPRIATLVLKASVNKGDCLEARIATPAWRPVLSLESVDGELWRRMREGFNSVLDVLAPRLPELVPIAQRRTAELISRGTIIDAPEITRLSLEIFLEFLFRRRDLGAHVNVLAEASWEWRKEIAFKGKARVSLKTSAVDTVVVLLRQDPELWALFGEEWTEPERYSLLMQPFLISPAINTCDIMVAVARAGSNVSLDDAIRSAHPFPILERYLADPVVDDNGEVLVAGNTQVLLFADDFASAASWPVFSSGRRACAGAQYARSYLTVLRSALMDHALFRPEEGHRFSGRNNDTLEWDELWYLLSSLPKTILCQPS